MPSRALPVHVLRERRQTAEAVMGLLYLLGTVTALASASRSWMRRARWPEGRRIRENLPDCASTNLTTRTERLRRAAHGSVRAAGRRGLCRVVRCRNRVCALVLGAPC